MKILYSGYTDAGGRTNNEDVYATVSADHGKLFVVADGLGGHDDGEKAANIAVNEIKERFLEEGEGFNPIRAILSANKKIIEQQAEDGSAMKTTVALAWISHEITHFVHVGDSRIYAFNLKGIVYQSPDHSVSQTAVEQGLISPADIRKHSERNKVTRALGAGEDLKVEARSIGNHLYDGLLLCTDGFWEYIYENEMHSLFLKSENPVFWLRKMRWMHQSRASMNADNHTAIAVFKIPEPAAPVTTASQKPAKAPVKEKKESKATVILLAVIAALLFVAVLGLTVILVFGVVEDSPRTEHSDIVTEYESQELESIESSEESYLSEFTSEEVSAESSELTESSQS